MDLLQTKKIFSQFVSNYGMVFVLVLLCVYYSAATLTQQHPEGEEAARVLAADLVENTPPNTSILIVAKNSREDMSFSESLKQLLDEAGFSSVAALNGDPQAVRKAFGEIVDGGGAPGLFATTRSFAPSVEKIKEQFPKLAAVPLETPSSYTWPTFLKADNLLNVANQIVVIAIIAVGMTMVIITAGIDLSVGSLIALSAVVTAWLIERSGGVEASTAAMVLCCLGAILLCGAFGAFSGTMITKFKLPPFIATLGMMQVASGCAYIISEGRPIYQIPDSFVWLGRGATPLFAIPNAVILMAIVYAAGHVLMSRTTLGRYIYAVGGNREAARLSGVRTDRVLLFVYTTCGLMAGLGGVVLASQLKGGAPTYGLMYELYVIAAVVVGGTSLAGGEGKIMGTLIGAFIIAVIWNGMNLTNVESYTQKVVLGLVILGAVLLDMLKKRGWKWRWE